MIHPQKQRFYWLLLQQDLFSIWCIRKIYGGLTNNHCREQWISYATQSEAAKALADVEYKRRQRGYIYADVPHPEHYHLRPQNLYEIQPQTKVKSNKIMGAASFELYINPSQQDMFINHNTDYSLLLQEAL
jgi:hypothetical protein